jgi:putative endonuclease
VYGATMNTEDQKSYVYILSNRHRNVVYIGSTDELIKRIYFHKKRLIPGFTKKYNVDRLVYFEQCNSTEQALKREKQIKGYRREKKIHLIQEMNPAWIDLYETLKR